MAENVNIISDELEPTNFGEFIDALIITNLRMWHAQEFFYELDLLKKLSKDEMYDKLKYGSWLNLQRNFQMDGLDAVFAAQLAERHPNLLAQQNETVDNELLWETI